MKIGFDARCLEEERISGVGEYTLELLENMIETNKNNRYIIFSNSFKQKNNFHFKRLEKYPNVELKRFSFPNKFFNLCLWYFNWPKLDKLIGGADIFFTPNINFISVSKNCPLVAAFHDLSFERYPHFFSQKTRLWHNYFVNPRRIAAQAKKIVAVSEATKKDLEEIYKTNPGKTKFIHHGSSQDFRPIEKNDPKLVEIRKKYNFPEKFILYLGNIEPRKNIPSIIRAYESLVSKNPELAKFKFILAGNMNPLCRDLFGKENITACGYIKREDRPFVYNLASLFVYPSFFEGFGLPPLEAMACGTPVVTSHNSSIPEVAGNATLLVNPNRPSEISEAMQSILMDEKLYDKMRKRGIAQAQEFSWTKCAKETLKLCELELMPAFLDQSEKDWADTRKN